MNQYKIGDTVWTRKRGKCRVILEVSSPANRPYRIMDQNGCFYYPKASNLYPSEAAMKQATQDEFIRANPILCGWNKAFTCGLFDIEPDPIQPKFKVGDAVYYKGGNWAIRERYWSGKEHRYNMSKPGISGDSLLLGISESGLRLWKETVLTQGMHSNGTWVTPVRGRYIIDPTWELTYLGEIIGHDTFLCKSKTNPTAKPSLFRGIKGDDI